MAKLATSAVVPPILARFLWHRDMVSTLITWRCSLLASPFANVGMMPTMTNASPTGPTMRHGAWVARSGALDQWHGVPFVGLAAGVLIWGTASHETAGVPIALAVVGVPA